MPNKPNRNGLLINELVCSSRFIYKIWFNFGISPPPDWYLIDAAATVRPGNTGNRVIIAADSRFGHIQAAIYLKSLVRIYVHYHYVAFHRCRVP